MHHSDLGTIRGEDARQAIYLRANRGSILRWAGWADKMSIETAIATYLT